MVVNKPAKKLAVLLKVEPKRDPAEFFSHCFPSSSSSFLSKSPKNGTFSLAKTSTSVNSLVNLSPNSESWSESEIISAEKNVNTPRMTMAKIRIEESAAKIFPHPHFVSFL